MTHHSPPGFSSEFRVFDPYVFYNFYTNFYRYTVMIAPQQPGFRRLRQLLLLVVRQFLAFSYYFSVYFKIL